MLNKKEMGEYIEECLNDPEKGLLNPIHTNGIEILEMMKKEKKFKKRLIAAIIENGKSVIQEAGHTPTTKKMKKVLEPEIIVVVAKAWYTNYITFTETVKKTNF